MEKRILRLLERFFGVGTAGSTVSAARSGASSSMASTSFSISRKSEEIGPEVGEYKESEGK